MTPTGEISKKLSGLTRWFTNLDIPKRHEDLILWKKYSPDEYPHYDNYDAINVDKVAEIPCDYCESWGLYPEEFETLDKAQWEEVRRERKDDTELIYVVPAKGTELRQALHEHSEGYKEKIEAELANTIYCSGCMGVPITVLDKYNPEQLEIVKFRKGDDEKDLTYTPYADTLNRQPTTDNRQPTTDNRQLRLTSEFWFARYCNGIIGVPITFLDKWSPEQFRFIWTTDRGGDGQLEQYKRPYSRWDAPVVNERGLYKRILIQKIL